MKWDGRTLAKQQQRKDTRFSSVEKRINMSMALDFLFTRTSWTLSWDVAQSPEGSSHPPEGSPFQHHNITSERPNIRLRWQQNRRILWPATECHWSDTEEGHSCCTRRRIQKSAGMLVETGKAFVDPSAMMTQMREDTSVTQAKSCWRSYWIDWSHKRRKSVRLHLSF